jgi:serine/threonine protein kinase
MAPEIHEGKAYRGREVDLFSAAIILFIMVTQHPPFTYAKLDDPFFQLIAKNRSDLFW